MPRQGKQPCGTCVGCRLPRTRPGTPLIDCSMMKGATIGSMHCTCERSICWPFAGGPLMHETEQQGGCAIQAAERIPQRRMQHGRRIVRRRPFTEGRPDACSSVEP